MDTKKIRHVLGPTLQFVNGQLDIATDAVQAQVDVPTALEPLVGDTLTYEGHVLNVLPSAVREMVSGHANIVDITRFAAGGVLTNATIDDAIDDAIAWAAAQVVEFSSPGYVVWVPAGRWELSRPHTIETPGTYRSAVSFMGAGSTRTWFIVDSDEECSSVFTFGSPTYTGDGIILSNRPAYGGFFILAKNVGNCRRHGISIHSSLQGSLSDVYVRGLGTTADGVWDEGHGIRVLEGIQNGEGINNQFLAIRDCISSDNKIGIWLGPNNYPLLLDRVSAEGNTIVNAVVEAHGYWRGGGVQGVDARPTGPYKGGRRMPPVVSGWSQVRASGTGATCSASTDGVCTVTGLTDGLSGFVSQREGEWLELISAGDTDNEKKTRGIYKILRVLSATSCTIQKASDHTEQTGLSWTVRAGGDANFTFYDLYDEGLDRPMFGFYRTLPGGYSRWCVERCVYSSSDNIVDARSAGKVSVIGAQQATGVSTQGMMELETDGRFSKVTYDHLSYPGILARHSPFPGGGYDAYPARYRDSGGPRAARLITACRELGAVEVWDARVNDSFTLDEGGVTSWAGLLHETPLEPPQEAPTYLDSDAGTNLFGTPCVAIATGTNSEAQYLYAAVDPEHIPPGEIVLSVMAVYRLPSTTDTPNRRIHASIGPSPYFYTSLVFADDLYATGGKVAVRSEGSAYAGGGWTTDVGSADTAPHVLIGHPTGPRVGATTDTAMDTIESGFISTRGATGTLSFRVGGFPNASGDLHIAFLAVFPHTLTPEEARRLVDLACNEWPNIINPPGV